MTGDLDALGRRPAGPGHTWREQACRFSSPRTGTRLLLCACGLSADRSSVVSQDRLTVSRLAGRPPGRPGPRRLDIRTGTRFPGMDWGGVTGLVGALGGVALGGWLSDRSQRRLLRESRE